MPRAQGSHRRHAIAIAIAETAAAGQAKGPLPRCGFIDG